MRAFVRTGLRLPRAHRDLAGFTLVETLLALAVTALLLGAAWRAVVQAMTTRVSVAASTAAANDTRTALLAIARELEGAAPVAVRVAEAPSSPALDWTAWEPAPRSVRWNVEDGRLVRRETSPLAPPGAPDGPAGVVVAGVTAFAVRAWDGGAWVDRWHGERPPRALALRLALAGAEALETHVTLPAAEAAD